MKCKSQFCGLSMKVKNALQNGFIFSEELKLTNKND